jgi:hypothetical protein
MYLEVKEDRKKLIVISA